MQGVRFTASWDGTIIYKTIFDLINSLSGGNSSWSIFDLANRTFISFGAISHNLYSFPVAIIYFKKTPGFVKSKFYPVISNPLKSKIYSIMGRKEKNSFEAYELLINEKYGEVEEDLQIEYLKNDFNI